jgi:hypothetical protein
MVIATASCNFSEVSSHLSGFFSLKQYRFRELRNGDAGDNGDDESEDSSLDIRLADNGFPDRV